jgi:4-hydroxy-2-oxoheptanedioate aldolase
MAVDTTKLRPSRVLAKMRGGGVASCIKLNLGDARVAEIASRAGFDCIWTDREHVPNTLEQIENQVRAAKVYDVDTIVRVPRGAYSELVWPLEMDAAGIMVPHVMSAADARQIAHLTRFHPLGRRPLDGGNADGGYCTLPVADYLRQANEQRLVIVQIEDPEPLDELEQIAAVPGIDMLFFGPGDFSQGIGHPGEMSHPRIVETRRRVAAVAREHGKFAGTVGTLASLSELTEMGYQFVSVGADVIALVQAFGEIAATFGQTARPVAGTYGAKAAQ